MSVHRKESSHHQDNKLLIEAITTRMEQVMNSKLDAFCQEVKQRRAQHKTSRGSREPSKTSRDKEKPPPWRQHDTPIERSKEQPKPFIDRAEHVYNYGLISTSNKLAVEKFDYEQERPRLRRPHEVPIGTSRDQSRPAKDRAKTVFSNGDQRSLQQTRKHQNVLGTQKIYDDLEEQILKAFKAVENSQKKSTTPRPYVAETTNQEQSCSKEKPVFQKPRTEQPLPICKGMDESSNSNMCANEIFMCHGREDNANAKPMMLEENAEDNKREQEKSSDSVINSYGHEAPPAEDELSENSTPCEVKSVLPSFKSDYVLESKNTCSELISLEPVQPSRVECVLQDHENLPEMTPRIMPMETMATHEPEPIPKEFLCENHNNHCKEIGVINTLPNLFVVVSLEEEKRFGLEGVKEFCVSGIAFDKMIQSFETLRHDEFSRQKDFLFNEVCDSNFALSHNLFRKTFDKKLIRNDNDFVNECFSKVEHFSLTRKELHNSKSYRENHVNLGCEEFWVLKLNETNSVLKENVFKSFSKLEQDYTWSERVLPEYRSNCALKEWWFYLSKIVKYPFIHNPTDMMCLSLSKGANAGFRTALRSKGRTLKREEDKRFKPPDLDQDKNQNVTLFMLIKQEPPDTESALRRNIGNHNSVREEDKRFKPPDLNQDKHQAISLFLLIKEAPPDATEAISCFISIKEAPPDATHKIGGNIVNLQDSVSANLSFVHADGLDLRTNPFQVGGDDMILISTKEMEFEPERSKLEVEEHGAAMNQIAPFELKENRGKSTKGYSSHAPFKSKLSDTCVTLCPRNSAIGQVIHWYSFSLLWFCPMRFSKERVLMRLLDHFLIIQLLRKSSSSSPQPRQFSVKKRGVEVQTKTHLHSGQISIMKRGEEVQPKINLHPHNLSAKKRSEEAQPNATYIHAIYVAIRQDFEFQTIGDKLLDFRTGFKHACLTFSFPCLLDISFVSFYVFLFLSLFSLFLVSILSSLML